MVIEQIIEGAIIGINPVLGTLLFTSGVGDVVVKELVPQALQTGNIIENFGLQLGIMINDIWNWILYNIFIPIMLLAYLILFFVGQYYLIKLYIFISRNLFTKITSAYNTLTEREVIDKNIRKVFTIFSK